MLQGASLDTFLPAYLVILFYKQKDVIGSFIFFKHLSIYSFYLIRLPFVKIIFLWKFAISSFDNSNDLEKRDGGQFYIWHKYNIFKKDTNNFASFSE